MELQLPRLRRLARRLRSHSCAYAVVDRDAVTMAGVRLPSVPSTPEKVLAVLKGA